MKKIKRKLAVLLLTLASLLVWLPLLLLLSAALMPERSEEHTSEIQSRTWISYAG